MIRTGFYYNKYKDEIIEVTKVSMFEESKCALETEIALNDHTSFTRKCGTVIEALLFKAIMDQRFEYLG